MVQGLRAREGRIWPDEIKGMDSLMEEAVTLKFIPAPLSQQQVSELVQLQKPGGK